MRKRKAIYIRIICAFWANTRIILEEIEIKPHIDGWFLDFGWKRIQRRCIFNR